MASRVSEEDREFPSFPEQNVVGVCERAHTQFSNWIFPFRMGLEMPVFFARLSVNIEHG